MNKPKKLTKKQVSEAMRMLATLRWQNTSKKEKSRLGIAMNEAKKRKRLAESGMLVAGNSWGGISKRKNH